MFFEQYTNIKNATELEGQYFLIIKIINKFMKHGKKTIIENIILQTRIHMKRE